MTVAVESAKIVAEVPPYRPYGVRVIRQRRLTPHFVRVTFTGAQLHTFGTEGLDQRVKLLFPLDGRCCDIGADAEQTEPMEWFRRWRALPVRRQSPIRTFTVRSARPCAAEIDIDFVDHGPIGAAGSWLARARPGDEIIIVGPDSRSAERGVGIDWRPGFASNALIIADETAVPAVAAILEGAPAGMTFRAFLEVPSMADIVPLRSSAEALITWLSRDCDQPGVGLLPALRSWSESIFGRGVGRAELAARDDGDDLLWDSPASGGTGPFYTWCAGEAGMIRSVRRMLLAVGLPRECAAFMGYWRAGYAGS